MKARKGYTKGMSRDITSDKTNAESYYNLENFRVVTEDGLTTGSLTNESSNTEKFTIPDLEEMTLSNGIVIPAQEELKIIGWTTVIDTIIVFTTNNDDEDPIGYGQIWSCEFNEATGTIEGLVNGALDADTHLLYNQALNFSTYHRIGRAIGRYENLNTIKVYWTDNYNSVRVFNTADEDTLNVPIGNIALTANVTMAQPVITDVGLGNLRTRAMIQFGYRLKTIGGAETIMSPSSTLYPLTEASIGSTVTWGDFAADMDTNRGGEDVETRSVSYEITGIDTTWDVIEHIAILFSERDVFTVYSFREENVPETGEVLVTCSDLSEAIQITTVEFNMLSSGFDIAKDIEVKGNRLIAANTKTSTFSIDFDARAYRFNDNQTALLTDVNEGDIVINGTSPDYEGVPTDHDAINPYNDESQLDWDTLHQYRTQSDGVTLGGSGANVSYEFTFKGGMYANWDSETAVTSEPPHMNVGSLPDTIDRPTTDALDSEGNPIRFARAGQLQNAAGANLTSVFTGYTRGEVYRFAIVFYGTSGSTTFANWIGDIRFPEPLDGNEYSVAYKDTSLLEMQSLGIKFTVDTSSVQDQISGYSIVRVRRDEDDRSKLGTAMLMWFCKYDAYDSLIHTWEGALGGGSTNINNPYPLESTVTVGAIDEDGYHLPMRPGWLTTQNDYQSARDVCFLMSPHGKNVDYTFREEDYLKTYGYYGAYAVQYGTEADSGADYNKSYAFYYKTNNWTSATGIHDVERMQIGKSVRLRTGEFLYSDNTYLDGYEGVDTLRNTSASRDSSGIGGGGTDDVPLGIGNPKIAIMLENEPTINNAIDHRTEMGYINDYNRQPQVHFPDDNDVSEEETYFKEVALCRYVTNQYGGNTSESRSINQYISTGHYQIVNDNIGSSVTFDVFGGDTYVNYFDDEYCEQYFDDESVFGEVYETATVNKLSVVTCYPTESIVNQDYMTSRRWFASRTAYDMGAYQSNTFTYYPVFSQEDTAKDIFFAESFLSNTVEEHPHQLWASQPKIDGEIVDNWRTFLVNDSIEVTGTYGPINRIVAHNEKVYYYQDSAVGVTTVDERVVVNDASGQALTLGTGGVFPDYRYISLLTGSTHQFSVVPTQNHIYHWDSRVRKMYRTSGMQTVPISDLKGMSSFFHKLSGQQLVDDYTLRATSLGGPVGVHGTPDYRYNRALFTFEGLLNVYDDVADIYSTSSETYDFTIGTIVIQDEVSYYVVYSYDYYPDSEEDIPDLSDSLSRWVRLSTPSDSAFTVSYNEMFDAFESFYSFVPTMYLQYGRRLLSTTPTDLNGVWEHNTSEDRCSFYGTTYPSVLETMLGAPAGPTSSFDNLQWQGTVTDSNGIDVQESFDSIRVHNEYQDSLTIPLVNGDNIKRKLRLWRTLVPRDNADNDPRIRAPWTNVTLTYNNTNNHKHTVKDIEYSFRPSKN